MRKAKCETYRRFRAVAMLHGDSIEALYKRLSLSARSVQVQAQNGNLGPELITELTRELGPSAVAFILGKTNTFTAPYHVPVQ